MDFVVILLFGNLALYKVFSYITIIIISLYCFLARKTCSYKLGCINDLKYLFDSGTALNLVFCMCQLFVKIKLLWNQVGSHSFPSFIMPVNSLSTRCISRNTILHLVAECFKATSNTWGPIASHQQDAYHCTLLPMLLGKSDHQVQPSESHQECVGTFLD